MVESQIIMKYYSVIGLIFNIIGLIFNILPFLGINQIDVAATIMFLIAIALNFGLIALNFKLVNRKDRKVGRWIKNTCWITIFVYIIAVFLLGISPILYSFLNMNNVMNLILSYCIFFGMAILITILDLMNINRSETWL
jgi:small-conductance mechanosensitive channel